MAVNNNVKKIPCDIHPCLCSGAGLPYPILPVLLGPCGISSSSDSTSGDSGRSVSGSFATMAPDVRSIVNCT